MVQVPSIDSYLWGYIGCGLKVQDERTGSIFRFRDVRPGSCSMDGVRPILRPLRWLFTDRGFPLLRSLIESYYSDAYGFALCSDYIAFKCRGSDNVYTASWDQDTVRFFVGCSAVGCIPPYLVYDVCHSYFVDYRGLLDCGAAVSTTMIGDVYAEVCSFVYRFAFVACSGFVSWFLGSVFF